VSLHRQANNPQEEMTEQTEITEQTEKSMIDALFRLFRHLSSTMATTKFVVTKETNNYSRKKRLVRRSSSEG
jgi:hypothetical protein